MLLALLVTLGVGLLAVVGALRGDGGIGDRWYGATGGSGSQQTSRGTGESVHSGPDAEESSRIPGIPSEDDDAILAQEEAAEGVSTTTMEGSVEQVATRLLASYRDAGDCVLADAGYLDLLGLVWGCVVQGDGWVDVCAVFEGQDASTCVVRVLRFDADEVEGLLGEEGW